MKSCSTKTWSVVFTMMIVGSWTTGSNAVDEPSTGPNAKDAKPVPVAGQSYQLYQQMQQLRGQADAKEKALFSKRPLTSLSGNIRAAAEAVRDAKGDEAKVDAQRHLSEVLGKYFDEDTKRREEELTQIEERLAKLRELLERRRAKKQDILELQMKVALNEADGLGFYDDAQSGRGKPGVDYFYRTNIEHDPMTILLNGPVPVEAPAKVDTSGLPSEPAPKPKSKSNSSSFETKTDLSR